MSETVPAEIAGYRIESELGRGGMGVVYLARQVFPDRSVALKVLAPGLAADPDFRDRFVRESNAAASTEHPNIVPIYGAGETEGRLYLAMRYVEGTDLADTIRREGPLDVERAVAICRQIASALDAAHARGIVHRDVKPGNVLLDASGHAYLSDFGLITRNEIETGITKTGQFMGSTAYCAPEQIKGENVDARTDVYSLGAVLYECLTGEPPFPRTSEAATLYAHLEESPPRPSAKVAELPAGLDDVVATAMAKRPDERYASAGLLAQAMRAALGPSAAGPATAPRVRRPWIVAAVAVVLAVVVAVSIALGGRSKPTTPSAGSADVLRDGLLAFDPTTHEVSTVVHLAYPRIGVYKQGSFNLPPPTAAGEGAVWTLVSQDLWRIDPTTGRAAQVDVTACAPASFSAIDVGPGAVWALCFGAGGDHQRIVVRVDPFTYATKTARTGVGGHGPLSEGNVATSPSSVWVEPGDGSVEWFDTARVLEVGDVADVSADALTVGEGKLWVANQLASTITPVNLRTGRAGSPVSISGNIDAIAVGEGGVWVLDRSGGTVTEIDAPSLTAQPSIGVGSGATSIAVGFGAVWVSKPADPSVIRVDPVTGQTETIEVHASPVRLVPDVQTGKLWLVVVPT